DADRSSDQAGPWRAGEGEQPGQGPAWVLDRLCAHLLAGEQDHQHERDENHAAGREEVEGQPDRQVVPLPETVEQDHVTWKGPSSAHDLPSLPSLSFRLAGANGP